MKKILISVLLLNALLLVRLSAKEVPAFEDSKHMGAHDGKIHCSAGKDAAGTTITFEIPANLQNDREAEKSLDGFARR